MVPCIVNINNAMSKQIRKAVSIVILAAFSMLSVNSPALAQTASADQLSWLPKPGARVHLSPEFNSALLKGIIIHPENALKFDFIVDKGEQKLAVGEKKAQYTKLIKYFLASLAVPDEDQWVTFLRMKKTVLLRKILVKPEWGEISWPRIIF